MKKLFVGKLAFSTSDATLSSLFEPFGPVISARIIKDKFSGESRGFGFVELESSEQMTQAIQQLDGQSVDGRSISVSEAREPRSFEGGARQGGGYRPSGGRGFSDRGDRGGYSRGGR